MTPALLPRHFVEKPWGRTDLPAEFGEHQERVGEVWYDRADEPLPVLVKWIFTSEKLSVQVHPDDTQAHKLGLASGKEECWIVTHAEPGATLGIGLKQSLTASQLREASLSGAVEHLMDWRPVSAGDWFYIPAGTVHAIGAGVTLVEIQQNADVTFRLYDYGRPRTLNLTEGVAVAMPRPYRGAHGRWSSEGFPDRPVVGPNFRISFLTDKDLAASRTPNDPLLLVPIRGRIWCGQRAATTGDVIISNSLVDISREDHSVCLLVELHV